MTGPDGDRMDRRVFLGTLTGGLLAARVAGAQPAEKVYRIGFVDAGSPPALNPAVAAGPGGPGDRVSRPRKLTPRRRHRGPRGPKAEGNEGQTRPGLLVG